MFPSRADTLRALAQAFSSSPVGITKSFQNKYIVVNDGDTVPRRWRPTATPTAITQPPQAQPQRPPDKATKRDSGSDHPGTATISTPDSDHPGKVTDISDHPTTATTTAPAAITTVNTETIRRQKPTGASSSSAIPTIPSQCAHATWISVS